MFTEKPKRDSKPRHINIRWLLIAVLVIPLPITILLNRRIEAGLFVDLLLIGFMLCCAVYIVYQAVAWLLTRGAADMSEDGNIAQS